MGREGEGKPNPLGYFNDPNATERRFRRSTVRSGDIFGATDRAAREADGTMRFDGRDPDGRAGGQHRRREGVRSRTAKKCCARIRYADALVVGSERDANVGAKSLVA